MDFRSFKDKDNNETPVIRRRLIAIALDGNDRCFFFLSWQSGFRGLLIRVL